MFVKFYVLLYFQTAPVAAAVEDGSGQILPVRSTPPPIPACPPVRFYICFMEKNVLVINWYNREFATT